MTLDLHDHLAALAEHGAATGDAPTSRLLARVHRRRATRTTATAAIGVVAAGTIALGAANGWPTTSSPDPAATDGWPTMSPPDPAATVMATEPPRTPSADPSTDPDGASTVGVWDLFPDSTLDLAAAREDAGITEALAAVPMMTGDTWGVYVLDTHGVWSWVAWPGSTSGYLQTASLSPNGSTVVMTIVDGATTLLATIDLANGSASASPLTVDGEPFWVSAADVSPDGTTLAVLGLAGGEGGTVVVGTLDLVTEDPSAFEVRTLDRYTTMSLDHSGGIAYSPDGSLLAVGTTGPTDGQEYTTILDSGGSEVLRWPMAMAAQPWYGNDALRITGRSPDDDAIQAGYLRVGAAMATTAAVEGDGEPSGADYGSPPQLVGRTVGQFVSATGDPAGAFRIEDGATGTVRTWLTVVVPDGWTVPGQLLQRTR